VKLRRSLLVFLLALSLAGSTVPVGAQSESSSAENGRSFDGVAEMIADALEQLARVLDPALDPVDADDEGGFREIQLLPDPAPRAGIWRITNKRGLVSCAAAGTIRVRDDGRVLVGRSLFDGQRAPVRMEWKPDDNRYEGTVRASARGCPDHAHLRRPRHQRGPHGRRDDRHHPGECGRQQGPLHRRSRSGLQAAGPVTPLPDITPRLHRTEESVRMRCS